MDISAHPEVSFSPFCLPKYPPEQMTARSQSFYEWLKTRRSVRDFSEKEVPQNVIKNALKAASSAPSGANKQPWTFCVVTSPELKQAIREAAEKEEYESYNGRMSKSWLKDLEPLGTNWQKPFLTVAPVLIVVFRKAYELDADGKKHQNYYVQESVGLACGMLLAALHHVGLATLTHTPNPMGFLSKILKRPENEKPFLLIPVGYPAKEAKVPNIRRKNLDEIMEWYGN